MLWLCEELERESITLSLERVECLPRELRAWRLARQEPWPIPASHFNSVAKEFLGRDAAGNVRTQLGFILEGTEHKLRFATIRAYTHVHYVSTQAIRINLKRRWQAFMSSIEGRRTPPMTCNAPFAVSESFLRMQPQEQARDLSPSI